MKGEHSHGGVKVRFTAILLNGRSANDAKMCFQAVDSAQTKCFVDVISTRCTLISGDQTATQLPHTSHKGQI